MGNNFHYFATHGLGYAKADTREAAIEKLVDGFRHDLKPWLLNSHKAGDPGVYIWTAKVNVPLDEGYTIEWFAPKGVDVEETLEHYLTYLSAKTFAVYHKPAAESLAGKEKAA